MFDEQTNAYERLICMGIISRDQKQVKDYDYITDLKIENRTTDRQDKKTNVSELRQRFNAIENNYFTKPENKNYPRKRSQLLNDLLEAAKTENLDQYYEDFAEYETRFRRRPEVVTTDLLNELRNDYSNFKSFTVGEVDMDQVDDLEYLLEGYLIKGENHQFYGGPGAGKTSLIAGMVKALFLGKPFLNQTRPRQSYRTLWVACDGSTSRFKAAYKDAGLDESMVDVWGGDNKQGRTNFKFTIPNLIKLRTDLENKEKNYGACVFDSVKGMLANTGFKYENNEQVELICQYLREIFGEPLGISNVLINHMASDGVSGSGAKRWGEIVAQNIEIQPCKEGNKENHDQRRICVWKDPINGRKFFNYTFEDGVFKPADSQEMVLNCYDKMKQYVQQINFKNGTTVFTRQDLLDIPDFGRTQVDRTKDEHLKRGGIFKPFKDSKGKTIRGKWVLKLEFRLSKPDKEPDPIPQVQIPTMV